MYLLQYNFFLILSTPKGGKMTVAMVTTVAMSKYFILFLGSPFDEAHQLVMIQLHH